MNIEKILPAFVLLCVGVGALVGYRTGNSAVAGAAAGLAVGFSPLLLLAVLFGLLTLWRPELPVCICGECESIDYAPVGTYTGPAESYFYKCPHCDREYRLNNDHFDLLSPEKSYQPYRVVSKWGRWTRSDTLGDSADSV